MPACQKCDAYLTPLQYANQDCPDCASHAPETSNGTDGDWQSAAKVTNLAEAGYLVSCLEGHDIASQLIEGESFSAVSGGWSPTYLLQVPAETLPDAREILRQESDQLQGEQPDYDEFGEPVEEKPVHLVFWRPVALMAVAGLATLWLGQQVPEPRQRVAPNRNQAALGAALEVLGKPLTVRTEAGQLEHLLHFDPQSRVWHLDSDTNGDGRLDARQQFDLEHAGP